MPLILISGYPSSGKTYRAKQIVRHFEERIQAASVPSPSSDSTGPSDPRLARLSVVYISDDTLAIPRSAYDNARAEKDARAGLASAIKRALGREVVVVADAMNYIKGFRYQLYCEAKALGTASCVVHIGTSTEKATELHTLRIASTPPPAENGASNPWPAPPPSSAASAQPPPYDPATFANLLQRYEEPNGMTRWDSPLFTVPFADAAPPNEAIFAALVGGGSNNSSSSGGSGGGGGAGSAAPRVRPNLATVAPPAASADALYVLDRATSGVVSAVQAFVADQGGSGGAADAGSISGASVPIPGSASPVILPALGGVTVGQLQRLRRQFVGLYRSRGVGMGAASASGKGTLPGKDGKVQEDPVVEAFVAFLNTAFGGDEE